MTEKIMEWWLQPIWLGIPYPDGSKKPAKITRQTWASYSQLIEDGHYTDEELASYADWYAESRNVPYELAFPIMVQQAPPNPRIFRLPVWAEKKFNKR